MSIHFQAEGYASTAGSYARGRPTYPVEMIAWMQDVTGVAAGDAALDLGAGTGKFTRTLVELGLAVVAVEPVDEMRAALAAALPSVRALAGTAHEIPLGDGAVDVVSCAQSFHWFADAASVTEIARVCRPGGHLVLTWNQRDLASPVQRTFEELLLAHQDPEIPHSPTGRWRRAIEMAEEFVPVAEAHFSHTHTMPRAVVFDRLRSMSMFSQLDRARQAELLARIDAVTPATAEVELPYTNESYIFRRA